MTKTHCDNCDGVLEAAPAREVLRSVLKSGFAVAVETIVYNPITNHRFDLCAACCRAILNTATQPYMTKPAA